MRYVLFTINAVFSIAFLIPIIWGFLAFLRGYISYSPNEYIFNAWALTIFVLTSGASLIVWSGFTRRMKWMIGLLSGVPSFMFLSMALTGRIAQVECGDCIVPFTGYLVDLLKAFVHMSG